jgi:hypothetical protein
MFDDASKENSKMANDIILNYANKSDKYMLAEKDIEINSLKSKIKDLEDSFKLEKLNVVKSNLE